VRVAVIEQVPAGRPAADEREAGDQDETESQHSSTLRTLVRRRRVEDPRHTHSIALPTDASARASLLPPTPDLQPSAVHEAPEAAALVPLIEVENVSRSGSPHPVRHVDDRVALFIRDPTARRVAERVAVEIRARRIRPTTRVAERVVGGERE